MIIEKDSLLQVRPCIKLIIAAEKYAPNDESGEALEFGLEMARETGEIVAAQHCRLEYDNGFYCEDSKSTACELRRAFKD
jgi:hypothetical protein